MAGGEHGTVHSVQVARSMLAVDGLARLLEAAYGLNEVRCRLIKGTIRDTYHVISREAPFIFSLYRYGQRTPGQIAAELDLLDHLAANGLAVAPALSLQSGERLLAVRAPEGIRSGALFTYVPGKHLERQPEPAPVRRYGRAIAELHYLADGLGAGLDRPHIGVEEMLDGSTTAFAAFADFTGERQADVAFLRETAALLRPRIAALPTGAPGYGLIHGDVIPSNAQVTPEGEVAVLDFDFCGYGWRAYDIATYLGEVAFWQAGDAVSAAFLEGYRSVRPIQEWEQAAIPLFRIARHIQSLGTPARNVNEWGSAYLSDRLIDTLLGNIRGGLAGLERSH